MQVFIEPLKFYTRYFDDLDVLVFEIVERNVYHHLSTVLGLSMADIYVKHGNILAEECYFKQNS
jgi:hypothetical protein